jgi:hypothetical protein
VSDRLDQFLTETASRVIEKLCDDPDVWLTHGCPREDKIARIERVMVQIFKARMLETVASTHPALN